MIEYWLLFAPRGQPVRGQGLAMWGFVLFYTVLGGLRFETGGDWLTYDEMFEDMRVDTLGYALTRTDAIYGLLNWFSAQLGTGIYLVNTVCCFVLGLGVIRAAGTFREPWLAVTIAVPYLLIVVGLGYVRQGASIGLMLMALASLDRARTRRTVLQLALAVGFHSTAVIAFPLFMLALTRRHKALSLIGAVVGAALFLFALMPRLEVLEAGYLDAEYESGGAFVRILMGLLPAALILARWRHFPASDRVRSVWLMIAVANALALVGLAVLPSSTAVDRIALFVSVIQLAAFGEIRALSGFAERAVLLLRLLMIGLAAAVQTVWLVFATHAEFWVPYNAIFYAQ